MNTFLGKLTSRTRFAVVATLAIAGLTAVSSGAFAAPTMTSTLSVTSVAAGDKVDLTTQVPGVSEVGAATQEIIQSIDSSKVRLTSASDVIAPEGWAVTYSTDGTNFSATPSSWAAVVKVKAAGSVNSGGLSGDGKQLYQTSATSPGTVTTPNGVSRSGGDGWDVEFDSRGYIYNWYHHGALNSGLDCRDRFTGQLCAGSWPMPLTTSGFVSNFQSTLFFDEVNQHIWLPTADRSTGTGFLCVDVATVSTPVLCGGSKATAWNMVNARAGADEQDIEQILTAGGKIYSWDIVAGKVICFDYLANNGMGAACTNMPAITVTAGAANAFLQNPTSSMTYFRSAFGNVYAQLNTSVACFNATTMEKCTGWTNYTQTLTPGSGHAMYLQPNAAGEIIGVCTATNAKCFGPNGTTFSTNSTVQAALNNGTMGRWMGSMTTVGSKFIFNNIWDKPSYIFCYDYATSAACSNWATSSVNGVTGVGQKSASRVYTLNPDPLSADCIWTNSDNGSPMIGQLTISTGQSGCSITLAASTFKQDDVNPRITCNATSGLGYDKFTLSGLTRGTDYTSASLTITKSNGEVLVSGGTTWSNITFNSQNFVDLSSIAQADLGQGGVFKINYLNKTSTSNAVGTLLMKSESAQLCLSMTANVVCPTTTQIVDLPTQQASFSATAATISPTNVRTEYSVNASDLSIAPPTVPSACGFELGGQVAHGEYAKSFPTTNVVRLAGVIATLLNSSGVEILDPATNNPITATSDASGNYSFGYLKAGSYKVRFADFPIVNGYGAGDVAMAYIAPFQYVGGSYTMPAQSTMNFTSVQTLNSPTVTGAAGGPAVVVKAAYTMRAVANPDEVSVKAGATANTIDVLLNDKPTTGDSFTTSSLKICAAGTTSGCALTTLTVANQGTYTVSSGKIVFTPVAGFSGVATPITYQVADSYSNTPQTVNSTLSVTVVPPPATSVDTQSGNMLAPITVDVTANDTASSGSTLVKSSVKLCASGTTTNCALTSVTIDGKGTYSVSALGIVTFTPESSFVGVAPALTYSIADSVGNISTNTVTATVTPTPPVITTPALPNAALGAAMEPIAQTLNLGNTSIPATGAWAITSGSLPPGVIFNVNTGEITGTPTALGEYPITVQVTDSAGLTATKAETLSVFNGPNITTSPLSYAYYNGAPMTITDTVTPGTGAIKPVSAWSATGLPAGTSINATTGVISGTPTTDGVYTVVVKVTDINNLSDTENLTLTVTTKPVITTTTPLPRAVLGVAISPIPQTKTQGTASIPATGAWAITAGALPAGLSLNPDTGEITGTATATGTFPFTVQLTDAAGEVATKAETISVIAPPTVTTSPLNRKFYSGTFNSITSTATIGTGAIAASGWSATSLPNGMSINAATGVISGTPTTNGTFVVTERVTDVNGLWDEEVLTITVVTKPVITTTTPLPVAITGVPVTPIAQTFTVGSGDIPATGAWSIVSGSLPAGLSFNPDTGEITGTPTTPGLFPFTVQLVASDGEIATKAESIAVGAPPVITTNPLSYKFYNGSPATLTNTATKGTANLMTTVGAWAATGLPTGVTINTATGQISGTPTVDGTYTVDLTVRDVNGLTDTETLTIVVVTKPTISTPSPLDQLVVGVEMTPEEQTFAKGTADIAPTGAWSISAGTLPAGMVLDPDTGEITGTPTFAGPYSVTVKLTDESGEFATKVLTGTVVAPPTITTTPVIYTNMVGTLATVKNTADKGTALIGTLGAWSATGLPDGFIIDVNTGAITGIGSVEGNFDVEVTVTDAAGLSDTTTVTIKVVEPPVITTNPVSYRATLGTPIAAIINTANRGTAEIPVTGSWSALYLPAGLAINADTGEITGKPSKVGSYLVTVKVTDQAGLTDTKGLTIAVVNPAKNQTILTLPSALVDGAVASDKGYPLSALGVSTKKLPVTYTAGPAKVCFVDSTKVLRMLGVGRCDVTASSGTGTMLSVDKKSFPVLKSPQTVRIVPPGTIGPDGKMAPAATDSANGFKLVSTMSSGLPPIYTSLDPAICLVEDDGTVSWMSDLVATPNLDKCRVKVTQPGNANFYPLVDTPSNIITVTATHVSKPAPAPVSPSGAAGTPRLPGVYTLGGGQWIVTVTNTALTIKPWSSGKFIGPVTADITVPYTMKVKGKVVKKYQKCKVVFGITKKYAVNDPMAWKSKAYANAKPCVLNKDAFAYFKSGKPINATAKVTRDRRWPTTMLPFKNDDGKGKPIPKDYKNWKINVG